MPAAAFSTNWGLSDVKQYHPFLGENRRANRLLITYLACQWGFCESPDHIRAYNSIRIRENIIVHAITTPRVCRLFQFSRAYQRATAGGYIGSDGTTSYFFDPKTGSSVMTGP
jgi:hypothetical protein